ncbi:Fur-regulated basic protein FbpA [Bacillus massilinigeriensis]|uniref:Fur-regulated basic protein FbpA n=1 Tax=Bacillus massilionigeriensis TaxID=1805475 RepID=UPI00096B35E4|nr:Fur-regulated basic protein FbpA [Bacillus massilionigeriensis]
MEETQRKDELIHELLRSGVYKKGNLHLFELSLDDLEKVYHYEIKKNEGGTKE